MRQLQRKPVTLRSNVRPCSSPRVYTRRGWPCSQKCHSRGSPGGGVTILGSDSSLTKVLRWNVNTLARRLATVVMPWLAEAGSSRVPVGSRISPIWLRCLGGGAAAAALFSGWREGGGVFLCAKGWVFLLFRRWGVLDFVGFLASGRWGFEGIL